MHNWHFTRKKNLHWFDKFFWLKFLKKKSAKRAMRECHSLFSKGAIWECHSLFLPRSGRGALNTLNLLPWFLAQNNTCVKIRNTMYTYCCEHYCKMMSFVTKFFMHKICKSTWKGFYSPITKEIQKIVILHLQCCTFSIERAWKKNQLFNGATETGPVTLVLHRFSSFNEK